MVSLNNDWRESRGDVYWRFDCRICTRFSCCGSAFISHRRYFWCLECSEHNDIQMVVWMSSWGCPEQCHQNFCFCSSLGDCRLDWLGRVYISHVGSIIQSSIGRGANEEYTVFFHLIFHFIWKKCRSKTIRWFICIWGLPFLWRRIYLLVPLVLLHTICSHPSISTTSTNQKPTLPFSTTLQNTGSTSQTSQSQPCSRSYRQHR